MGKTDGISHAMDEMKRGNKSGFKVFFEATIQYVYRYSYALFKNSDDATLFVVEYYPYLYMRIETYSKDQELKKWMLGLINNRYTELTGVRPKDFGLISNQKINELSKDEIARIWQLLELRIHFPKEEKKRGISTPFKILIAIALISALALFILYKVAPSFQNKASESVDNVSSSNESVEDGDIKTVQELQELMEEATSEKDATATKEAVEDMIDNLDYPNMNPESNIDMTIEDNIPDSLVQSNSQSEKTTSSYKGNISDETLNSFLHSSGNTSSSDKDDDSDEIKLELKYGDGLYFTQR